MNERRTRAFSRSRYALWPLQRLVNLWLLRGEATHTTPLFMTRYFIRATSLLANRSGWYLRGFNRVAVNLLDLLDSAGGTQNSAISGERSLLNATPTRHFNDKENRTRRKMNKEARERTRWNRGADFVNNRMQFAGDRIQELARGFAAARPLGKEAVVRRRLRTCGRERASKSRGEEVAESLKRVSRRRNYSEFRLGWSGIGSRSCRVPAPREPPRRTRFPPTPTTGPPTNHPTLFPAMTSSARARERERPPS